METDARCVKITLEQIADLAESTYTLADVRDELSFRYGTIPQAKHMPDVLRQAEDGALDASQQYILFCMHGLQSLGLAAQLQEKGFAHGVSTAVTVRGCAKTPSGQIDPPRSKIRSRETVQRETVRAVCEPFWSIGRICTFLNPCDEGIFPERSQSVFSINLLRHLAQRLCFNRSLKVIK